MDLMANAEIKGWLAGLDTPALSTRDRKTPLERT